MFNNFSRIKANIINSKEGKLDEYIKKREELQADLKHRFEALKILKSIFAYFVSPFICDII